MQGRTRLRYTIDAAAVIYLKIGNVEIKGYAALAPMAGVADRAFRELCVGYGASYAVGEMASSKGISMNDRKSAALLTITSAERPAASQIFGDDPLVMANAAVKALDYAPDVIDINMGCPAPKVAGNGGGSALMKNPKLAAMITAEVVHAVDIPVTVKIRAGWDSDSINAVEMAKYLEDAGAAAITVHGRTRAQMYAPPVNVNIIREVKNAVGIPVIGNGDIIDGITAARMYEDTNCDLVMIGRGALGRPWVFSQIEAYIKNDVLLPEPPVSERMRVMAKHIEKIIEYKGEYIGIREARKHAAWYMTGLKGASSFRRQAGKLENIEQVYELAYNVCKENME